MVQQFILRVNTQIHLLMQKNVDFIGTVWNNQYLQFGVLFQRTLYVEHMYGMNSITSLISMANENRIYSYQTTSSEAGSRCGWMDG